MVSAFSFLYLPSAFFKLHSISALNDKTSLAVVPYFFYDVGFIIFGSFLRYFCVWKLPAILPLSPFGSSSSSYQQGNDYDRFKKHIGRQTLADLTCQIIVIYSQYPDTY